MTQYNNPGDPNGYPGDPNAYPGGGYQQYPAQGPNGYPMGAGPYGPPTAKNYLGGWALGLGIAALCCGFFTAIPAIIMGKRGMDAADRGEATNKGQAQAGFIIGIVGVVWGVLAVIYQLSSS